MADYSSLLDALDAGVNNMTVLRNNVKNDEGTTTYQTGIDWFKFNSVTVSDIYSNGNSWIGLGASSEQVKVNRRDNSVYYEYEETGKIKNMDFFRFRWRGCSYWYSKGDTYLQEYEIFLLSSGQIYLNFITVPTSNFTGTNALVCGSETVNYSVTAGSPCEYTFTPSDPDTGTGWSVAAGKPTITSFKSSGQAEFAFTNIHNVTSAIFSEITWSASVPDNTSLKIYARLDNATYTEMTSGSALPIPTGSSLENSTLYIKAELATTDSSLTPSLSWLHIKIRDVDDKDTLVLTIAPGLTNSLQNASGAVTVVYDGSGGLIGEGGSVAQFSETFTPTGLVRKPHQNDVEHIEITDITGNLNQINIVYSSAQNGSENVAITNVSATGTRIYVGDI